MITVKKLIELLEGFPADMEVILPGGKDIKNIRTTYDYKVMIANSKKSANVYDNKLIPNYEEKNI